MEEYAPMAAPSEQLKDDSFSSLVLPSVSSLVSSLDFSSAY